MCFLIEDSHINKLPPQSAKKMVIKFEMAEINKAMKEIDPAKSPGPDGFNGFYIRNFWDYIKNDIFAFMNSFNDECILPQGINSSFIVLIPKVENPTLVQHFRPISLINCTMKILLKLLANRLKDHLQLLVSDSQFAFMKGMLISDCILRVAHTP